VNDLAPEKAYPQDLETWRITKSGLKIFLRPIKIRRRIEAGIFCLDMEFL